MTAFGVKAGAISETLLLDPLAVPRLTAAREHIMADADAQRMAAFAASESADVGDDFWPDPTSWEAKYRPYIVRKGILQIPVMGVLLHRMSWTFGSWATGYQYIQRALMRGLADDEVRGIAYIVDSPGGVVAGNMELADRIFEARKVKPARAYASDSAYSAAYSLASAAGEITVSRSGGVGSIGVIAMHVEYEGALQQSGVGVTLIFAGKHKADGNAYEKLPADVRERFQTRIDKTYDAFCACVARNRGISVEEIKATEAKTYDAEDAIAVELADNVGELDDSIEDFAAELSRRGEQMAQDAQQQQANSVAEIARAREEGVAAGRAQGRTDERARISEIVGSEAAKTRPIAAMSTAMRTDMSAADAALFLASLPEEVSVTATTTKEPSKKADTTFDAAMSGSGVKGGEDDSGDKDDSPEARARAILSDFGRARGATIKK